MSTPFENWIVCPVCEGTGGDDSVTDWDVDYGPPKCERCEGVGEIDPADATAEERAQSDRVQTDIDAEFDL